MKNTFSNIGRFILRFTFFCFCFSFLLVFTYRWIPVSYTPLMFIRMVENVGEENNRIKHHWVNRDEIANSLQLAVVCTEDQHFLVHYGFDFEQIKAAMEEAEEGGRQRGASTISQQTAKNVFCWPSSNFLRKGMETWFTILIEICWSKERIMEVYLNSIEFGDGIYGCEAAAKHFFKKSAVRLNSAESARLAVVLTNPHRFKVNASSGYVVRRQTWALQQMGFWGGVLNYHPEEKAETTKKNRK
jgi:monofunctional glycosyltransferase